MQTSRSGLLVGWFAVLAVFGMMAKTEAQTISAIEIQVTSTRTDLPYNAILNDPTSYVFIIVNSTMCTDIIDAIGSQNVVAITTLLFQDALPGIKATIKVTVALGSLDALGKYSQISTAIVTAAASRDFWMVESADITFVATVEVPDFVEGTSVDMRIMSTRTDLPFSVSLLDPTSDLFSAVNISMCQDVVDAVSPLQFVVSCNTESLADAGTGVLASLRLLTKVTDMTENDGFLQAANAIVAAASLRTTWIVGLSDITLLTTEPPTVRSGCCIQTEFSLSLLMTFFLLILM